MSARRIFRAGFLLFFVFLLVREMPVTASDHVTFTHGVAGGDVTQASAVVWTRIDEETPIKIEVSRDPDFHRLDFQQTINVSAASDLTAKTVVTSLQSSTQYYYRWRHGNSLSDVGTFRTAPTASVSSTFRFVYSGDSDGTRIGGVPALNNFEVLDAVRAENPSFFIYLGDTIYSDSVYRTTGPATTLADYREAYKINREIPALPRLLKSTSTYALWDDHEFRDDSGGQSLDPMSTRIRAIEVVRVLHGTRNISAIM